MRLFISPCVPPSLPRVKYKLSSPQGFVSKHNFKSINKLLCLNPFFLIFFSLPPTRLGGWNKKAQREWDLRRGRRDVPGSWSCHLTVLLGMICWWRKAGKRVQGKLFPPPLFCSLTDGSRIHVMLLFLNFFFLIMVINVSCGWSLAGGRSCD